MRTIAIKPLDTVFFRNGKPFDMGEDNWAEGQFFPYPSVFYGAIRSAFFASNPDLIDSIGRPSDPTVNFQITGIFLAQSGNIFVPAPLDLVREKNDSDGRFSEISFIEKSDVQCYMNYPYPLIPFSESDVEALPGSFISIDGLKRYFARRGSIRLKEMDEFAKNEPKIGVGLDRRTRSSREGKLFRVGMRRFRQKYNTKEGDIEESYFAVSYTGLNPFPGNLVKLGAEGKVARIEKMPNVELPSLSQSVRQLKYFKLILLTPTIFQNGSIPSLENLLPDIKVELMTAFVGKPEAVGGWDLLNRKPKEMVKAVPAGSVYYYEIKSHHTVDDVEHELSKVISISEGSQEQMKSGFGLFTLAVWEPTLKIHSI